MMLGFKAAATARRTRPDRPLSITASSAAMHRLFMTTPESSSEFESALATSAQMPENMTGALVEHLAEVLWVVSAQCCCSTQHIVKHQLVKVQCALNCEA
jgi:hypothetical protein